MAYRLRSLCLLALLMLFSSITNLLQAQAFAGEKLSHSSLKLEKTFTAYEIFKLDASSMATFVQSNVESNLTLHLGDHNWSLSLVSSELISPDYTLKVGNGTDDNEVIHHQPNIAFKGYEANGGKVRLSMDRDFLYGAIQEGDLIWYVEPLRYIEPGAANDLFVLYERQNAIGNPDAKCGVTEEMERAAMLEKEHEDDEPHMTDQLAVYELELAIASDQLMLAAYGSSGAVEAHNIAIINMVEGDYTGSFDHDLCFDIVTQFVATAFPGPWSASNDAGTLLNSFTTWGNGGNFGVTFDIGELWTDRDFTGGTVGIAWLNGVCNSNKYHCLQDFTGDEDLLRCMTSHEIGHNFSAGHDVCSSGTFIMCPFVSNATAWSSNSQNSISSYMQTRINNGCLQLCSNEPPLVSQFTWSPEPGCVNQPVQFTDQSLGNITSWSWVFTGGSPSTSTQQNPSITFNTPGPHNVTLTVSNASGGSAGHQETINIDPLPTANFTYTVDNLTLTFTNTSQNATDYFWEFGDGGESTDFEPTYTYSDAGNYVVKLHATNHCGTVIKTFTVTTFPAAMFSAEPTVGCAPLVVQMINESSNNSISYQWSFPGGSPAASTQANPLVLYTVPGVYTITLTAFNSVGFTSFTQTNYITVGTVPAPGFTFSSNGLTVTFTNTSVNGTTYNWDFGDGSNSNEVNPVHTYSFADDYVVVLTVTNDCGSTEITKNISLAPPPVASFTSSGNSGCAPLTVAFTNTSTNATSYSWAFPGGDPATSTSTSPTVTYATPGIYTVTLTAFNASGSSTATSTVTVLTVPNAGFNSSTDGSTASFTNTTTNGDTYSWNFGDGGTSSEQNPTYNYSADGVYTVVLTATNACGSSTTTQTVTITTPPTADFSAGPQSGCAPLTVQYSNNSSDNTTSFAWTFPGGNPGSSTAQNPTVVYATPGVYSATLIAGNSAGSDTLTFNNYITVNTTPTVGFSSTNNGATVAFTNSSTGATSYSWDFGDGANSTEANPTHTYANDGVYTVVLSATNACGTVTTTQTVTIVTPPTASFNGGPTSGCVPMTVQFNNTSSDNAVNFEWQFPGGEPSSSTEQNPSVTYNTPGVYTVVLTASNSAGSNTSTLVDYITVGTTPNAGFSSLVDMLTTTFTNSSNNATSYSWDFGDGNNSTDVNPVHTYAADGNYVVVLTATNACGASTFTQSVAIITEPDAGFSASTTSGCGPLEVNYVNLSSENSTSWEWTFEGGTPATSTEENPSVVYAAPGVYDVTLVATGPGGSSTFTQQNFITVLAPPVGGFTFNQTQNSVAFTNTSTDATSYSWTFGDGGTSVEQNPTYTYTADGVYTVVLAATNNCGTTFVEQTVTIVTAPIAAFTFNNASGCAPLTVQFNNTSSENATSFGWEFQGGDPSTSSLENPSATWNAPGVYVVILTATNSAGSSTATATITVNTVPTAGFTSQTAGLSVVFENTTSGANSYTWAFGDGTTSTETNPTHAYPSTGTYSVTMTATNACGTVTVVKDITISGSAPLTMFVSNLTSGCAGMTVQFTDESIGDPTSWSWTFAGGSPATSTDQNPSVTYAAPGVYDVTLEATNIYGSNTSTLVGYITIVELPTAGFNFNVNAGVVTFNNTSLGGSSYAWDFGDGTSSTDINPVHTYETSGTYTVSQTVTNACGASTLQQTVVVVLVGTNEAAWLEQFRLFPNPNAGYFTLEMTGEPHKDVELAMFNGLGQLIRSEIVDFSTGNLAKSLDFGYLPSAVYTLRITAGAQSTNVKVVIQK